MTELQTSREKVLLLSAAECSGWEIRSATVDLAKGGGVCHCLRNVQCAGSHIRQGCRNGPATCFCRRPQSVRPAGGLAGAPPQVGGSALMRRGISNTDMESSYYGQMKLECGRLGLTSVHRGQFSTLGLTQGGRWIIRTRTLLKMPHQIAGMHAGFKKWRGSSSI